MFLFQKVAQCSEIYETTILRYFILQIWLILYSKFLENLPKYHQKWPNYFLSQKMLNVLKPMEKQFFDFCDFYFMRYGRFCTKKS